MVSPTLDHQGSPSTFYIKKKKIFLFFSVMEKCDPIKFPKTYSVIELNEIHRDWRSFPPPPFFFNLRNLCLYSSHEHALLISDCSEYKRPTAPAAALRHPSQQVWRSHTSHGLHQPTSDHSKNAEMRPILGSPGLWLEDSPNHLAESSWDSTVPSDTSPQPSSRCLSFTCSQVNTELDTLQLLSALSPDSPWRHFL